MGDWRAKFTKHSLIRAVESVENKLLKKEGSGAIPYWQEVGARRVSVGRESRASVD